MKTLVLGMLLSGAFVGIVKADDYQVVLIPGGAYIYDHSPVQPPPAAPAAASSNTAILALELQLAMTQQAAPQKRIVDVAIFGRCDKYVAYQVTYDDGSFTTTDVASSQEYIDLEQLAKFHKKFPVVHLAGNECENGR